MWIAYALLVHVLLLGSIFVIYFRSPVIKGLQPQEDLKAEPPANRLVLIVTDGLRADSFFADNCNHVPHLREIFLQKAVVGISRTRVPTESRPGHIALIAGLYEDPSAVTRGWKENPIEFDTVFNRSGHTYAWGAHDILHIFEKLSDGGRPMYFDAYNHDLDFSGKHKTYKLDEWVFKRVRLLLRRKQEELKNEKKLVFFLHLLGLDTAGHVHKPGTPLFLENLNFTEHGIWDIYNLFESVFPDKRTAYLLTSDHGMTDSGSHGAGAPQETDTPFMLWGAGVLSSISTDKKFVANDLGQKLPLHELEQAQLTPLMSALIGLPPPMNNFGVLPLGYIDAGIKYEALAAYSNALQLISQYTILQQQHKKGFFAACLNSFEKLTSEEINAFIAKHSKRQILEEYDQSLNESYIIMKLALEGIDYYHGYYRNVLLLCTTATFLGWIFYLYRLLIQDTNQCKQAPTVNNWVDYVTPIVSIASILLIVFIVFQRVPITVGFYLLLPLPVWLIALRQIGENSHIAVDIQTYSKPKVAIRAEISKFQLILLIALAELLVFTFFERRLISMCFVAFACYTNWGLITVKSVKFCLWTILVVLLSSFPLLPPSVGYQNNILLLTGIVVVLLRALICNHSYSWHTNLFNGLILVNTTICVHLHSQQIAVPLPLKIFSWLYLAYAIVSIKLNNQSVLELRLAQVNYNLGALYTVLCTSYESLFIQLLAMELTMTLAFQHLQKGPMQYQQKSVQHSLRVAFTILLYTLFSLFGSGNIASVSSFDPNIARCFLSHFAPFIIMSLVLLKLMVPIVLNFSILYTHCEYMRQYERQIFICLLILCDIMGMNFLFLVRNTGSWLEIGSSISHFVIMEVTTLVLLILAFAAKVFLSLANCDGILAKLQ